MFICAVTSAMSANDYLRKTSIAATAANMQHIGSE